MSGLRGMARAARLRCPACGGRPIVLRWFRMVPNCPRCGLRLDRGEDGYWVGSYMFNLVASELCWAALLGAIVLFTWPTPPWDLLLYGGAALMVLAPVAFLPFAKTLFLAFDLLFRPPTESDFTGPIEPALRPRDDSPRAEAGPQPPAA